MEKIVVGWDSSAGAERALALAAHEARLHGAEVVVVHAWTPAAHATVVGALGAVPAIDEQELGRAEEAHAEILRRAEAQLGDIPHSLRLARGDAGKALLAEASDADLLVVGTRGRGGFRELLLGSVSQKCAHHATCPVIVVPPPVAG